MIPSPAPARNRNVRAVLPALFFALLPAAAFAFQLEGMKTPESFIVDPATGTYYVSNINGKPKEKDNNGFISKIDPSGKLIDRQFIAAGKNAVEELHAPKGLAVRGDNLYVTDIDAVRRFDKNTGRQLGVIDFKALGAEFLNDLATDTDGHVYVSDTFGNAIYRIDPANNVTIVSKDPGLGQPNGLLYDAPRQRLIAVTWGSGKAIAVGMDGKTMPLLKETFKNLDGVDFDRQGNLIFSSFTEGKIYRVKNFSKVETLRSNLVTPADISFDYKNNQILVPSFDGNLVFTVPLE